MSKETREYAKQLVSQMTLEEKMSQMVYQSPAIERLGIPAYNWWNEALHGVARAGVATVFPQAIGLAATFDKELLQEIGDVVSTEGRAKFNEFSRKGDRGIYKGLTFWAPNVNIFRDPRWGRGHETYGEDPYLTGELDAPTSADYRDRTRITRRQRRVPNISPSTAAQRRSAMSLTQESVNMICMTPICMPSNAVSRMQKSRQSWARITVSTVNRHAEARHC